VKETSTINNQNTSQPIILPSWALPTTNCVFTKLNTSTTPFDTEAHYVVKPAFLKVIRTVPDVNQEQTVFHYKEVNKTILMQ